MNVVWFPTQSPCRPCTNKNHCFGNSCWVGVAGSSKYEKGKIVWRTFRRLFASLLYVQVYGQMSIFEAFTVAFSVCVDTVRCSVWQYTSNQRWQGQRAPTLATNIQWKYKRTQITLGLLPNNLQLEASPPTPSQCKWILFHPPSSSQILHQIMLKCTCSKLILPLDQP